MWIDMRGATACMLVKLLPGNRSVHILGVYKQCVLTGTSAGLRRNAAAVQGRRALGQLAAAAELPLLLLLACHYSWRACLPSAPHITDSDLWCKLTSWSSSTCILMEASWISMLLQEHWASDKF